MTLRGVNWLRLLLLAVVLLVAVPPLWRARQSSLQSRFHDTARDIVAAEDWERLDELTARWLKDFPRDNAGLLFKAEAAAQLGRLEEAAEWLHKIDNNYQGALEALAIRAELLFADLNRPLEAEACWLRMLDINARATVPRQRLIYFYALTLQRDKLRMQIETAMQLGCEPPEAYSYLMMLNALNFSDGLTVLTKWRRAVPEDEALEVAQAVYAAKKTADKALATFGIQTIIPGNRSLLDRCRQKYPDNVEVLALLIEFAMFEGAVEDVAELLAQSGESAEEDSRFWRYRGWLLSELNRFEEAEQSLRRALELLPYDWQSRWLLADVLRKLQKTAEAETISQQALRGKDLQTKLFERPNARNLSDELAEEIYEYLDSLGPNLALAALERRI